MRSINWKKVLLISWAVLLIFGLSFQAEQAEALHVSCGQECQDNCPLGCDAYGGSGCNCFWRCSGGGGGSSVCVI